MKQELDIYEALNWLSERVLLQRIIERTNHTQVWFSQKYTNRYTVNGKQYRFNANDLPELQHAWDGLAERISTLSLLPNQDTEGRIANWKILNEVFPIKFFENVLGVKRAYIDNRTRKNTKCLWTSEDVTRINSAITAMYSYMRNITLVVENSQQPTQQ